MKICKILSIGVLLSAIQLQQSYAGMSATTDQTLLNIVEVVQALKQHDPSSQVPTTPVPSSSPGVMIAPATSPFAGSFAITQSTNLNVVSVNNFLQPGNSVSLRYGGTQTAGSITSLNSISIGLTDANQSQYATVIFGQQVLSDPNIAPLVAPGGPGIYIQISLQVINGTNCAVVQLTDTTSAQNVLATGYVPVSGQPTIANMAFNQPNSLISTGVNQMVYNGFLFAGKQFLYQTLVAQQSNVTTVSTPGVQAGFSGNTNFSGTFTPSQAVGLPIVSVNNPTQYQQYAQQVVHTNNQFVSGSISQLQFMNVGLSDQNMNGYATVVFPASVLQQSNIAPLIAPGGKGICFQVTLQTINGINYAIVQLTDATPQANVLATGVLPNIQGNPTIANIGFNMHNTHPVVGNNQMFANGFLFQKARLLYLNNSSASTTPQPITQVVPQTTPGVEILENSNPVYPGTFTPTSTQNLKVNYLQDAVDQVTIQSLNLLSIAFTDDAQSGFIGAIFPQSLLQQANIAPLIAPGAAGIYINMSLQTLNGVNYGIIQLTDTTPQANVLATAVLPNVQGNPTFANIGFNMRDSQVEPAANQLALNLYSYPGTQLLYQTPKLAPQAASPAASPAGASATPQPLTTTAGVQIVGSVTAPNVFLGKFRPTPSNGLNAVLMDKLQGNLRGLKNGLFGASGSVTSLNTISVGLTDANQVNYIGAVFPAAVLQQPNIAPLIAPGGVGIYIEITLQVLNGVNTAIIALTDTFSNVLAVALVPNVVGRPGIANIGFNVEDTQVPLQENQMVVNGFLYIGNKLFYQTPA